MSDDVKRESGSGIPIVKIGIGAAIAGAAVYWASRNPRDVVRSGPPTNPADPYARNKVMIGGKIQGINRPAYNIKQIEEMGLARFSRGEVLENIRLGAGRGGPAAWSLGNFAPGYMAGQDNIFNYIKAQAADKYNVFAMFDPTGTGVGDTITNNLKRLQSLGEQAGNLKVSYQAVPEWGMRMVLEKGGQVQRTVDMPLMVGRRAFMGGRVYELPSYIGMGADNIMHVSDALVKMVSSNASYRKGAKGFAGAVERSVEDLMRFSEISDVTQIAGMKTPLSQQALVTREGLINLDAFQQLQLLRGKTTVGQVQDVMREHFSHLPGWQGIKQQHEAAGLIMSGSIKNQNPRLLEHLGIRSGMSQTETEGRITALISTEKGERMMRGYMRRPSLSQSQMQGTAIADPTHEAGRILRSGAVASRPWEGIKSGMLAGFQGGPGGLTSLTGAMENIPGVTTHGMLITDPSVAALLGFDPHAAGGGFARSTNLRKTLATQLPVSFKVPLVGGEAVVSDKVRKQIMQQALTGKGQVTLAENEVVAIAERALKGDFQTFSQMDEAAREEYARLLKTRGDVTITKSTLSPDREYLLIQGMMPDETLAATINGAHGSWVREFSGTQAKKISQAVAGKFNLPKQSRVNVVGYIRDLKERELLQSAYAELAMQQPNPQAAQTVRRMAEAELRQRAITPEGYRRFVAGLKQQGFQAESRLKFDPTGKFTGYQTAMVDREVFGNLGYDSRTIAALPKQVEVAMPALFTTVGKEPYSYLPGVYGKGRGLTLGWQEMTMLSMRRGHDKVHQALMRHALKQAGSSGREFAAMFGQFGLLENVGGEMLPMKGVNPGALTARVMMPEGLTGKFKEVQYRLGDQPIKWGSREAREIGREARSLLNKLEAGESMSASASDFFFRYMGKEGQFKPGFMLELPKGQSLPISETAGGYQNIKARGTMGVGGQIYMPGLAEAVPDVRVPGDLAFADSIAKAKLRTLAELDSPTGGLASLGKEYDVLLRQSSKMFTKKGGWKNMFGLTSTPSASGYLHQIEQGQVALKDRLGFVASTNVEEYRKIRDMLSSGDEAVVRRGHQLLREELAGTVFISPEAAKRAGLLRQMEKHGQAYGIIGRWPMVAPGSIGVARYAVAESMSNMPKSVAVSRAMMMFMGGDTDFDKVANFFYNDKVLKHTFTEHAFANQQKMAEAAERYIFSRVADTDSMKYIEDLAQAFGDEKAPWKILQQKYAGTPAELSQRIMEARFATSGLTGSLTNKMWMQFELLQDKVLSGKLGEAGRLHAGAVADVLGLGVIESAIKMRKHAMASEGSMIASELMNLMESGQTDELTKLLASVTTEIRSGGRAGKQFKQGSAVPGMPWGDLVEEALAKGQPLEEVLQPVASLMTETYKEAQEIWKGTDKIVDQIRRGWMEMGTREVQELLGNLATSKTFTPMQKQMAKASLVASFSGQTGELAGLGEFISDKFEVPGMVSKAGKEMLEQIMTDGLTKQGKGGASKVLGKLDQGFLSKMGIGAAAVLGVYAASRMVSGRKSPPPKPQTPLDDPTYQGDTGLQPAYVRDDMDPMRTIDHSYNVRIGGQTANVDMLRRMAEEGRGRVSINDNSISDRQFQYQLGQRQSSRFGT